MPFASQHISFQSSLAVEAADVTASQRLRYSVFAREFGGTGTGFDHKAQLEQDAFDTQADHLILKDNTRPDADQVIAVTRLIRGKKAADFYTTSEFDLSRLLGSGLELLEMSRTCVHPDYRGGTALLRLWQGLATYVTDHAIDLIFGVASFPGADPAAHTSALALLHQDHLVPDALRPIAVGDAAVSSNAYADHPFNRRAALISMPALIKAYLRMGGTVGDGAYADVGFGTTDVCMILETAQLSARQRAFLGVQGIG